MRVFKKKIRSPRLKFKNYPKMKLRNQQPKKKSRLRRKRKSISKKTKIANLGKEVLRMFNLKFILEVVEEVKGKEPDPKTLGRHALPTGEILRILHGFLANNLILSVTTSLLLRLEKDLELKRIRRRLNYLPKTTLLI